MSSRTLEFENAHFLQSLFAGEAGLLKVVARTFDLKVTTRDNWVKLEGDDDVAIEQGVELFRRLEETRRDGADISEHSFRFAVEAVRAGESGALKELMGYRLLGTGTKPPVVPKTRGQLNYLKAMDRSDVVFGTGPAGTGKTYLAMARLISALKNNEVKRIILTRPAVEAGEALGFLPGDLQDKILPYLRPLYDALYDMLEPTEVERMIERGMIEIAPLAYMRGRTLNQAAIILDEAQNTTREQMFMFLTRLGDDSRCVVTGDPSQIDLKTRHDSGLLESMEALKQTEGIEFVKFEKADVVRHPVVRRIIEAYGDHRNTSQE
ncbi:MAG: phosphate starvation-inducible PhoH-like protein [Verrucomicrobiales bacterium]|jgi:phosphate starvation-inducible PhoH-like protein